MERISFSILLALLFCSPTLLAGEVVPGPGEPPLVSDGFNPAKAIQEFKNLQQRARKWPEVNVSADFSKIQRDLGTYSENQKPCQSREERANTFCIEARNPDVQQYVIITQTLMAGLTGVADSCEKFGKLMNLGNTTLGVYQAQCATWKGMCASACRTAKSAVVSARTNSEALKKNFEIQARKALDEARSPADIARLEAGIKEFPSEVDVFVQTYLEPELNLSGDYRPVARKFETCKNYATQLATATLGAVGFVMSMAQAKDCHKNSSNHFAAPTPVDCTIPANKQNNMTCICQDAPRTPGCNSGLDSSVAAKGADTLRSASTSDYVPGKGGSDKVAISDGKGSLDLGSKTDGGSSSSPGAPVSGGSAGIDGGSGLKGSAGPPGAAQKAAGLNTNILGGEGGSGGGGGGGWSSGGSDDGLRQYLPGGAKDPSKTGDPSMGMAGSAPAMKQVTSPTGKSNWEKVRERYRDNKSTLLNY